MVDVALEVLLTEKERVEGEEEEEAQKPQKRQKTSHPQVSVDKAVEVENAFKILMHNATEEFGFAPRDVYNGVFYLLETKGMYAAEVKALTCSDLKTLVQTYVKTRGFVSGTSHKLIVVSPVGHLVKNGQWEINLKSIRIAKKVVETMAISSAASQGALLWRDGSSRRSPIACSLADPGRSLPSWSPTTILLLPSPQVPLPRPPLPLVPRRYIPSHHASPPALLTLRLPVPMLVAPGFPRKSTSPTSSVM
jgi:hypothetical protein